MKPEISIIIPCFNCRNTLEESLSSCYRQNLEENGSKYEIILVDDKSTDNTLQTIHTLVKKYQKLYPNVPIQSIKHSENRGGGSARNSGINISKGKYILCFDSDDILVDNTLPIMIKHLKNTGMDGVTFEGGLSFSKNIHNFKKYTFDVEPTKTINIFDFFDGKNVGVTSNFLYTKDAYFATGGYPTCHNFDTQGFGVNFLMKGFRACICPNAFFYQRQFASNLSYFERSYNSGEFSLGHFFILLETLHILSNRIQQMILNYDIFNKNRLNQKNILSEIVEEHRRNSDSFYIPDYKKYINPEGALMYTMDYPPQQNPISELIKAHYLWTTHNTLESIKEYYEYLVNSKDISPSVYFALFHFILSEKMIDKRVMLSQKTIANMMLDKVSSDIKRPTYLRRALRKIFKIIGIKI